MIRRLAPALEHIATQRRRTGVSQQIFQLAAAGSRFSIDQLVVFTGKFHSGCKGERLINTVLL